MKDKYSLKKEKVANLLFDLVKYLLTTIGAVILLGKETPSIKTVITASIIAIVVFSLAVAITPTKEE